MVCSGFECPDNTTPQARYVLRQLRKYGVVQFTHDDGYSLLVRVELEKIAGEIGIDYYPGSHSLILVDRIKCIRGDMSKRPLCKPYNITQE